MKKYYGPEYSDIPNTTNRANASQIEQEVSGKSNGGVWALITFLILFAIIILIAVASYFMFKSINKISEATQAANSYDYSDSLGEYDDLVDTEPQVDLEVESEETTELNPEDFDMAYEYAYANYTDNGIDVYPNGAVNDDTVLMGKKMGDFVEYIDTEILDEGYHINKDLFYDMVSVEIIDPSMYTEEDALYFEQTMAYCISMSYSFMDDDVNINKCMLDYSDNTLQKFDVSFYGANDIWVMDLTNDKFYMADGDKEYTTSMLDRENTIAVWMYAADEFYGFNAGN